MLNAVMNSQQQEVYLLSSIHHTLPIRFYLPYAPAEVQDEYCKLNKLANIVSKLEDSDKKKYMLSEYHKRVEFYQLMCKESLYGTLEELLKE